jgi:hypothetical protein
MKSRYVRRDGLVMRIGSVEWRRYVRHHLYRRVRVILQRRRKPANEKRAAIVKEALSLVGIHEEPMGSNQGPQVHEIQSATGAFGAPWCVSTVQYIWKKALGSTWAQDTANAYFLAGFAENNHCTIPHPVAGCAVVYHMGDGHAGTVVRANRNGTFWAVEGNWGDAVVHILRDPHTIPCTFVLRPELR